MRPFPVEPRHVTGQQSLALRLGERHRRERRLRIGANPLPKRRVVEDAAAQGVDEVDVHAAPIPHAA